MPHAYTEDQLVERPALRDPYATFPEGEESWGCLHGCFAGAECDRLRTCFLNDKNCF